MIREAGTVVLAGGIISVGMDSVEPGSVSAAAAGLGVRIAAGLLGRARVEGVCLVGQGGLLQ